MSVAAFIVRCRGIVEPTTRLLLGDLYGGLYIDRKRLDGGGKTEEGSSNKSVVSSHAIATARPSGRYFQCICCRTGGQ